MVSSSADWCGGRQTLLVLRGPCIPVASYEPELFPGLIYRMVKPRIVLLIFVSGKVVLTGKLTKPEVKQTYIIICVNMM